MLITSIDRSAAPTRESRRFRIQDRIGFIGRQIEEQQSQNDPPQPYAYMSNVERVSTDIDKKNKWKLLGEKKSVPRRSGRAITHASTDSACETVYFG